MGKSILPPLACHKKLPLSPCHLCPEKKYFEYCKSMSSMINFKFTYFWIFDSFLYKVEVASQFVCNIHDLARVLDLFNTLSVGIVAKFERLFNWWGKISTNSCDDIAHSSDFHISYVYYVWQIIQVYVYWNSILLLLKALQVVLLYVN